MKKISLAKIIASSLVASSLLALNPLGVSAEWKKDNTGWWYSEGNSWSVGWKELDGQWYYFDSTGYMKTGWMQDGGKWYYLDQSGYMKSGWVQDGSKWYYLDKSGYMKTGWLKDNDKWYYLKNSGEMAKDTTIDGYKLDSNGAWIETSQNNSAQNTATSLSNVNPNGTTISSVTGVKSDSITKIVFYDGRGGYNKPITVEDKQKIKEFMGYLDGYTIKKTQDPETVGWAQSADLYINDKKVMDITFGNPVYINGDYFKVTQGNLDTDKIDKYLKTIDASHLTAAEIDAKATQSNTK